MQVEILLSCGHIIIVPVESVLLAPSVGMEIKCSNCKKNSTVSKVGIPYRVDRPVISENKNQRSMMGDK